MASFSATRLESAMRANSDSVIPSSSARPLTLSSVDSSMRRPIVTIFFSAMSSGQLLLPFEAIPQPANSYVKARIAVGTIPNPEYGWLRRFDATSDFAITESVIGRNVVKNLFSRVHKPNYTRMDSFRQYTNERSFAKQNSQMNTSATMSQVLSK